MTISPAIGTVGTGGALQFNATIQGTTPDKSVTWKASPGSITSSGIYHAPASPGTATVVATSNADPRRSSAAAVVITAPSVTDSGGVVTSVTISPPSASSATTGTLPFSATVQGTGQNKGVTWKASLGSISSSGVFTAPTTSASVTVTATSNADPTQSASAIVAVSAARSSAPVIATFTATPSMIQAGESSTLQWRVTGAASLNLTGVATVNGTLSKVTPSETTTYTLTATNSSMSVTRSLTVLVQQNSSQQATGLGSVVVDTTKPGIRIPGAFMGFSHEWDGPVVLMGKPGGTNPIYRQLIKNLLAYGGGPIVIRIGGNTTDGTGEPVAGAVGPMSQLAEDIGAKFTLGVNLGSDNVQLALDQARNYVDNMPKGSLNAIEVGNEPDLYYENGLRSSSYNFNDYLADFAKWQGEISTVLPQGVGFMGPSWSLQRSLPNLGAFLAQEHPNMSIVSQHYYAGTGTGNAPDYLLQDSAATKGATTMASSVILAHNAGLPFRIGEMNSIAGGGEPGVSNTFASALWSLDTLFEFANTGADGVNIHGTSSSYALFTFDFAISGGKTTFRLLSVRPEYYGVLLFQQATANGARLLPVALTTGANLKVWATKDTEGTVRIVLINKDQKAQGVVNISLPGFSSGVVSRLAAANYRATNGVTIGGQTFDGSTDGNLQNAAQSETIEPMAGVYSVAVSPTSAVLLTVQP
jgi:Glycosyl hydrolase family 79 C-terminal beta domain